MLIHLSMVAKWPMFRCFIVKTRDCVPGEIKALVAEDHVFLKQDSFLCFSLSLTHSIFNAIQYNARQSIS